MLRFVSFHFLFRFFIHVIWECLCWNLKLDSDAWWYNNSEFGTMSSVEENMTFLVLSVWAFPFYVLFSFLFVNACFGFSHNESLWCCLFIVYAFIVLFHLFAWRIWNRCIDDEIDIKMRYDNKVEGEATRDMWIKGMRINSIICRENILVAHHEHIYNWSLNVICIILVLKHEKLGLRLCSVECVISRLKVLGYMEIF